MYEFLFNLLLVAHGARKAYLLEISNVEYLNKAPLFLELVHTLGFYYILDKISLDDFPRYWITRQKLKYVPVTDRGVGSLLGFKDPGTKGVDFSNYLVPRTSSVGTTSIEFIEKTTNTSITIEVAFGTLASIKNYATKKIKNFNDALAHLHYRFTYKITKDDGTLIRLKNLRAKNMKYIRSHEHEYLNDIMNWLDINHPLVGIFQQALTDDLIFNKYYPIFLHFYDIYNQQLDIDTLDVLIKNQ